MDSGVVDRAAGGGADEARVLGQALAYRLIQGQGVAVVRRKQRHELGLDGTELSAGEWQRIATARAFLRKADIIILDEPTSMMDSWSEADWFERLSVLASGRTAIVITHRLTIAMRAHLIYVMMNGSVVESGSHQELLDLGGQYAFSWRTQTESQSGKPTAVAQPV